MAAWYGKQFPRVVVCCFLLVIVILDVCAFVNSYTTEAGVVVSLAAVSASATNTRKRREIP